MKKIMPTQKSIQFLDILQKANNHHMSNSRQFDNSEKKASNKSAQEVKALTEKQPLKTVTTKKIKLADVQITSFVPEQPKILPLALKADKNENLSLENSAKKHIYNSAQKSTASKLDLNVPSPALQNEIYTFKNYLSSNSDKPSIVPNNITGKQQVLDIDKNEKFKQLFL